MYHMHVMLLSHVYHMTFVPHLPSELGALSQSSGSKRVPLGDEPSTWVDHPPTTIGDISIIDQLPSSALLTQALNEDERVNIENNE